MEGRFPLKTEMEWKKDGENYILSTGPGSSLTMDPVSFLVWIQCDGKTSIEGIIDVFSVGGNKDIIRTAIMGVFEKLTTAGAITWV